MYQKKDYIFSETFGVCRIEDVTKLNRKNEEQRMYYVLKSIETGKTSYIPVEGHKVLLRPLVTKAEAMEKRDTIDKEKQLLEWKEIEYVLSKEQ